MAVSSGSSVLQNTLFNKAAKKYLKCSGDVYRYHIFLNLVCVILFMSVAVLEKFPFSLYSLVLGTVFGIVTAFSSVFKVKALANGPMHITVLITTSSMLLPTVSGVFISGEHFSAYRMLAAAVLVFFLYLSCGGGKGGKVNKKWIFYCAMSFLLIGGIGILQKIHQSSIHKNEISCFLAAAFFISMLLTALLAKKYGCSDNFNAKQLICAGLCGICTFIMHFLNLKLSGVLPSQLFFPLVNGSAMIISALVSVFFFKEKLTKKQLIGLIGGTVALTAICLLP